MVRFHQSGLVSVPAAAQRRSRPGAFSWLYLLFGAPLFAVATIFLTGLDPVGRGAFVTAVGAAENSVSERLRSAPHQDHCLSRQEQRARIAAHAAIPLGKAVRAVKGRGDLLRARLCERHGKLLYLLTLLGRGGKVQRVAIDASTGALVGPPH